jgi:16S rRNA processing protein RimM
LISLGDEQPVASADGPATDAATAETEELIVLGEVRGVFGVRGWIKVRSLARPADGILKYRHWSLSGRETAQRYALAEHQPARDGFAVRLVGVSTREAAEALVGQQISVPASALPPSPVGAYYWRDLIGMRVSNTGGVPLGTVSGLLETGAADVLVVTGERERLIPFVIPRYVHAVDLARREMVVDWHPDD